VLTLAGSTYLHAAGGTSNVYVGNVAGNIKSTGTFNAGFGYESLTANATGGENASYGAYSLATNSAGMYNTADGYGALQNNSTGSGNTAVGLDSGINNTTGLYNTSVGYNAGVTTGNLTNATAIGANAQVSVSNALVLGQAGTNVGIGTAAPLAPLNIQSDVIGPSEGAQFQIQSAGYPSERLIMGYLPTASGGYGSIQATNSGVANTALVLNPNGGPVILGGLGSNIGIGTSAPNAPLTIQSDFVGLNEGAQLQIQSAAYPAQRLIMGYAQSSVGGFGTIQATETNVQNTPLFLNPNGGPVAIGFTTCGCPFNIQRGFGSAYADAWLIYSSRRWKTNIHTLTGALEKVEKLRGVSYDLKANGKTQIGVIAEEAGAVVPELVEWEENGTDAKGVDYARLTALLIEATKEQQRQIRQERALRQAAERHEAETITRVEAVVENLTLQVQNERAALQEVRAQIAASQRIAVAQTLVAAK
jgi:hypothetical protein